MHNSVEMIGKTIDEAVISALEEMNVVKEMVEVRVIDQPSKGLFGIIGGKDAKVQVYIKENYYLNRAEEFITNLVKKMDVDATISVEETEDKISIDIKGDNVGILIGKRGDTLDSIQYLVTLVLNRYRNCGKKIIVDIENYREKRIKSLEEFAKRVADKVVRFKKKIVLEPMSPYERRIIHSTLQENNKVITYSSGNEPNRKVIIKLK